jgi:exodeoxyribonuclease V alpha subunit
MPLEYAVGEPGRAKQTDPAFRQAQMDLPAESTSSTAFTSLSTSSSSTAAATVSLEAFCENIIFRNEENGYTVALFSKKQPGSGDTGAAGSPGTRTPLEFTAVGSMPFLEAGDYASLAGKWVVHGTYGQQLQVENYAQITPHTSEDILEYLSSGSIPGIGAKTAERIVGAFGDDSIRIMREEPEKLSRIKGITAAKARQISAQMLEKGDFQELSLLLTPFGIGAGRILSIYKRFGSSSQFVVRNNPFRLADEVNGIGFHTADSLASHFGCDAASPYRIGSAIMYCILQAENEGHTYLPLPALLDRASSLLSFSPDDETVKSALEGGYRQLLDTHKLVAFRMEKDEEFSLASSDEISGKIRAALPKTLESELASAKIIAEKLQHGNAYPASIETENKVSLSAKQMGIELAPEQKSAVFMAVHSYVSIITGGPGTGKTTIIRVLTDFFQSNGKKIVLCAPTGRAAKRMSEASGISAKTIHRLLEMERGGESNASIVFKRNEENPIEADAVIVDEVSMLDSFLFCCLLRAVGPKTQIILVGDSDQLPSVGSGNVLADLIHSDVIPVERLTQIFRQAAQSRIVLNAHRILSGEPILFDQSLDSDCMLVSMSSAPLIAQAVTRLCSSVLPNVYGIDVQRDTAVLSPSRKGPAGINALNPLLQEALGNTGEPHCLSHGFSYRISDKVMQTRNNYDLSYISQDKTQGTGVFNGEIGFVREIDPAADCITVEMDDGRTVVYDRAAMDDLEPAYAITVHKSQGSEYPVVILAIAPGSPLLNNRNLLYTAITRAKKKLFIVTSRSTLERMIKSYAQNSRLTSLCEFLRVYHAEAKESGDVQNE